MKTDLTDKQREALEHVERARGAGMRISDYARAQRIGVRSIYDSMVALRRKGLLSPQRATGKSAFVAVRVKSVSSGAPISVPSGGGLICRLRVGAVLIECAQWPPAAWVAALASGQADAAS
jgi:hypothetical protein